MTGYTTERRRAARLRLSPERRREISRIGGMRRVAKAGRDAMVAMAKAAAVVRKSTQSPERRSEIARIGAIAANASRSKEQASAWGRLGGYHSHKAKR